MDCEVLVVGGGPAGASAARFLSNKGISTILVEKNFNFAKPCGGGIPSAGLKDVNIFDEVVENLPFNKISKVRIFPPFSSPIEVNFIGGYIFIFNRLQFDIFLKKLAQKEGAKIIEAELVDLEITKDKIKSTVKNKHNELFKISSKYLVAADGINSKVCTLMGLNRPDYYWTVSIQLPENFIEKKDTIEFWFGSSYASFFYSWVFPGTDYLSVGTGAEDIKKLVFFIDNFVRNRFSIDLKNINGKKLSKLRAYKIPRWEKRAFFKENIIFCGDAAGLTMPVSFEGIYYAMKSAQFAAEAIEKRNLKLYEKFWNDRFLKQFKIMKKFQDVMFGNDKKIDDWLNIHREPSIQQLAMAIWLRKEHGKNIFPLYLKAFHSFIMKFPKELLYEFKI